MADAVWYPLESALVNATERQTAYAASVCHLFTDALLAPTPATPLSEYTAAEATFTNYAAAPFALWNVPILAPGSGFMIESPFHQFTTGAGPVLVTNQVKGAYIVDAGGDLRMVIVFGDAIPMDSPYQGIPFQVVDFFPTGYAP